MEGGGVLVGVVKGVLEEILTRRVDNRHDLFPYLSLKDYDFDLNWSD